MHAIQRRTVASAVAVFFAAAPLAIGGAAYAEDPQPETGSQVVFTGGGLLGVACDAKPSSSSVTVPAESTLRVVNNTGRKAKLLLDGAARGEVAAGATADVLFHHGPVELALKPDCVLADEKAVRVEVLAAPPPPADNHDDTPADEPAPAAGGGDDNDPGSAPTVGDDAPSDDADEPDEPDTAPTADADDPAAAGPDAEPSTDAADPAAGMATDDFLDPSGGNGGEGATTVAGAAAEPLASVEPVSEGGPTGLLALIATICVAGVSAGAIRAIIAQRATRTRAA